MATHIGSEGIVKVGANTVAEVISFTVQTQTNLANDTALGDAWESNIAGTKSWSGTVECHWDETDTNGQEAMTDGASVSLVLCPEGATAGDVRYSGTALITGISRNTSGNNDTVKASFSFTGTGALTRASA